RRGVDGELAADRGQRHVHDRGVYDRHEERSDEDGADGGLGGHTDSLFVGEESTTQPACPTRETPTGPRPPDETLLVACRGDRIRTDGLPLPKRTRYQTAPHPVVPRG